MTVAYVSRGKLFLKEAGDPARELESAFGEAARARSHPGTRAANRSPIRIAVASVTRGRGRNELLYALDADSVNGVFAFDTAANVEARLFHSADRRVRHLDTRGDQGFVVCDVAQSDGTSSIAVMQADGSDITIVTEGDALDLAPRWIPGEDRAIVYQSAGVGRSDGGARIALGPFSIQKIDLRKGELETLAQDPKLDFLAPQIAADGALYFIARPYENDRARGASFGEAVRAVLLVIHRLVAHLIRAWTGVWTRRRSAPREAASARANEAPLVLWGTAVDPVRHAIAPSGDDPAAIVPASWRLCRRAAGEEDVIVASGVVSFDLDGKGGLVFSNGNAIYAIDAHGKKRRLCTGDAIEQVALLA